MNIFPYDSDTANLIKELEEYIEVTHKSIYEMRKDEIGEYITKLNSLITLKKQENI